MDRYLCWIEFDEFIKEIPREFYDDDYDKLTMVEATFVDYWFNGLETISMMVNECFELGEFKEAMETFKLGSCTTRCYINIIERFCERGMMSEAEDLFQKMWSDKDLLLFYEVATFRSMINGYDMVGRLDDAQKMLKKMVDTSLLKVSVHQAN